jgi:hypothetical protein
LASPDSSNPAAPWSTSGDKSSFIPLLQKDCFLPTVHASLTNSTSYGFNIPVGGTHFRYVHPLEPEIALSTSPFSRPRMAAKTEGRQNFGYRNQYDCN